MRKGGKYGLEELARKDKKGSEKDNIRVKKSIKKAQIKQKSELQRIRKEL